MDNELILYGPFTQILTMDHLPHSGPIKDESLEIIYDGGIVIKDDKIFQVGKYSELKIKYEKKVEFDFPTIAIPGLIDAHTHLCWAGSRARDYELKLQGLTYLEIAELGGGILDTVKKTRQATHKELEELLKERIEHLNGLGITTCEIKSGYGLTFEDEIKILQVIENVNHQVDTTLVSTCLAAHVIPPEFASGSEYLNYLTESLLPFIKEKKLSNRIDIFIEKSAFNQHEGREYLLKAKEMDFKLIIHADQFSIGGSHVAADVKALSADHLEVSTEKEFELLKQNKVIPIILPGASLGLGIPFAPARRLLDYNLPLVIASDWNPGSAPQGNLLVQSSLLSIYEKLTIAETLASITYRAACALELEDRGKIITNKRADIAIFPSSDYREIFYYQGSLTPINIVIGGKLHQLY